MEDYEVNFNKKFFNILKTNQNEDWLINLFSKILKRTDLSKISFSEFQTSDGNKPDGLMQTENIACIIENKTISTTSVKQLENYAKSLVNDFNQVNKSLLLIAPKFNQNDIAISQFNESVYFKKIQFHWYTWEELYKDTELYETPKDFKELLRNISKEIAYQTFDKLYLPIFKDLCNSGLLTEKSMNIRSKTGETKYYQKQYFFKNTKDRLRIGFNENQISEFTIAWYSVYYQNKSWTMGTKLKAETKNNPDIYKQLESIKNISYNYPILNHRKNEELTKEEVLLLKEKFIKDISLMHEKVLVQTKRNN